jgi:hypothetical protein
VFFLENPGDLGVDPVCGMFVDYDESSVSIGDIMKSFRKSGYATS